MICGGRWRPGLRGPARRPRAVTANCSPWPLALVSECRGWDVETELLSHWQAYRALFPHLPSQSRFNRRRRQLWGAFQELRRAVLRLLDLAQDRQCAIDSLPVPVVQFHLVPQSTGDWASHGATFGKVSSKKQTLYGYKLHLLVTLSGVILDFILAPANATDLAVGYEMLTQHGDLDVVGDKAYISAPVAAALWADQRIRLIPDHRPAGQSARSVAAGPVPPDQRRPPDH